MWEVDPETKSKLAALQKRPGNSQCIDCAAPSPQWASPKFGTFICLTCAGLHRGLGVHISFVRSIQMDSFKAAEIKRMDLGGNEAWRVFWEGETGREWGRPGEGGDAGAGRVVGERYGGGVGEEWKERLGCLVDGREFCGVVRRGGEAAATDVHKGGSKEGGGGRSRKEINEEFFAKKGGQNEGRPEGVAPSLGGKYAGFGSEPVASPPGAGGGGGGGGVEAFQVDPVGALTKGFWGFAGAVGKGAKTLNEGYIQPTAQKIAEADLAAQARLTAAQAAKTIQTGTKGAAEKFNSFVENAGEGGGVRAGAGAGVGGRSRGTVQPEKKDFWDSFGGDAGGSSAIGTSAMRKGEGKREEGGWGEW